MNSKVLGRKNRKAWDPNVKLWRGTESWRVLDERRPRGFVILQEVREIWRATSVQGFEGQGGEFELYAPMNLLVNQKLGQSDQLYLSKELGVNRHFQASWASQLMGRLLSFLYIVR